MMLYFKKEKNKSILFATLTMLVYWIISISYEVSKFLTTATICPFVLILTLYFLKQANLGKKIHAVFRWFGKYTFALYVSNTLVAWTMTTYKHFYLDHMHFIEIFSLYLISQIVFGYPFIKLQLLFDRLYNLKNQ